MASTAVAIALPEERVADVKSQAQLPMSQVNMSIIAPTVLGAMVVGAAVGVLTNNNYFAYSMVALPLMAFFAVGIFADSKPMTRPAGGPQDSSLPMVALVLSCVGATVVGIALGHASRSLIRTRGGQGDRIALAALVVGYSAVGIHVSIAIWLLTFFMQLQDAMLL